VPAFFELKGYPDSYREGGRTGDRQFNLRRALFYKTKFIFFKVETNVNDQQLEITAV
jgi:hypothetical protein